MVIRMRWCPGWPSLPFPPARRIMSGFWCISCRHLYRYMRKIDEGDEVVRLSQSKARVPYFNKYSGLTIVPFGELRFFFNKYLTWFTNKSSRSSGTNNLNLTAKSAVWPDLRTPNLLNYGTTTDFKGGRHRYILHTYLIFQ